MKYIIITIATLIAVAVYAVARFILADNRQGLPESEDVEVE